MRDDELSQELEAVAKLGEDWTKKLKADPSMHAIGIRLLYLFILDLLGRDTVESKVFEQQVMDQCDETVVVSWLAKAVAFAVVFTLDVYVIFATLLYAKDKGLMWQKLFLITAASNIITDIFVSKLNRVLILKVAIPDTISSSVLTVR